MPGVAIDTELVRCLLSEQFPQLASQAIRPVEPGGWDNRTFRVGPHLSARLPSAAEYVPAIDKEHRWLPRLAEHLPVRIPAPVARGRPGCGFPWSWSLYRWLPGVAARVDRIDDMSRFATDLARFLSALHAIDATSGPVASAHSFGRGGPLALYNDETRATAEALGPALDLSAAMELWEAALAEPYRGQPVWVHGDVTASNLLVAHGRLTGVIDFGACAVGDPACDLVIAWTFLAGRSRDAFRAALPLDPNTWMRARGWALWKALLTLAEPARQAEAVRRYGWTSRPREIIDELIAEHGAASGS